MRANITGDERQLRSVAAAALETMFAAAAKEGISLTLQSGYRSYELQTSVYNRYVSRQGKAVADSQSARPGYSEHQTGLGADIGTATGNCNVETCFAETKEGIWLASNAPSFGFVIRYPEGKTAVTGYIYEPWHIRYVGSELAQKQKASQSTTLEEYLGLEAAPDYN
jgi:D-alanyl-D-alanine carboxypeptidase